MMLLNLMFIVGVAVAILCRPTVATPEECANSECALADAAPTSNKANKSNQVLITQQKQRPKPILSTERKLTKAEELRQTERARKPSKESVEIVATQVVQPQRAKRQLRNVQTELAGQLRLQAQHNRQHQEAGVFGDFAPFDFATVERQQGHTADSRTDNDMDYMDKNNNNLAYRIYSNDLYTGKNREHSLPQQSALERSSAYRRRHTYTSLAAAAQVLQQQQHQDYKRRLARTLQRAGIETAEVMRGATEGVNDNNDFLLQLSALNEPAARKRSLNDNNNNGIAADVYVDNYSNNGNKAVTGYTKWYNKNNSNDNDNGNSIALERKSGPLYFLEHNYLDNRPAKEDDAWAESENEHAKNQNEDASDADDELASGLPYGIQNVRKRKSLEQHRNRGTTYQSLCPTKRVSIPLETAGYEYRPNHYIEVTCANNYTPQHHSHDNIKNKICSEAGFSCIQLNRTLHLIRRHKPALDMDCWESEIRIVPSGCECMWPKHNYGDIVAYHDVHKRYTPQVIDEAAADYQVGTGYLEMPRVEAETNGVELPVGMKTLAEGTGFEMIEFN